MGDGAARAADDYMIRVATMTDEEWEDSQMQQIKELRGENKRLRDTIGRAAKRYRKQRDEIERLDALVIQLAGEEHSDFPPPGEGGR